MRGLERDSQITTCHFYVSMYVLILSANDRVRNKRDLSPKNCDRIHALIYEINQVIKSLVERVVLLIFLFVLIKHHSDHVCLDVVGSINREGYRMICLSVSSYVLYFSVE
jgi:hypothetical protein